MSSKKLSRATPVALKQASTPHNLVGPFIVYIFDIPSSSNSGARAGAGKGKETSSSSNSGARAGAGAGKGKETKRILLFGEDHKAVSKRKKDQLTWKEPSHIWYHQYICKLLEDFQRTKKCLDFYIEDDYYSKPNDESRIKAKDITKCYEKKFTDDKFSTKYLTYLRSIFKDFLPKQKNIRYHSFDLRKDSNTSLDPFSDYIYQSYYPRCSDTIQFNRIVRFLFQSDPVYEFMCHDEKQDVYIETDTQLHMVYMKYHNDYAAARKLQRDFTTFFKETPVKTEKDYQQWTKFLLGDKNGFAKTYELYQNSYDQIYRIFEYYNTEIIENVGVGMSPIHSVWYTYTIN